MALYSDSDGKIMIKYDEESDRFVIAYHFHGHRQELSFDRFQMLMRSDRLVRDASPLHIIHEQLDPIPRPDKEYLYDLLEHHSLPNKILKRAVNSKKHGWIPLPNRKGGWGGARANSGRGGSHVTLTQEQFEKLERVRISCIRESALNQNDNFFLPYLATWQRAYHRKCMPDSTRKKFFDDRDRVQRLTIWQGKPIPDDISGLL